MENTTDLHQAAQEGNRELVEQLIQKGADLNAKDEFGAPILLIAAEEGYEEGVQLLIENGADVNITEKYEEAPLNRVADKGH